MNPDFPDIEHSKDKLTIAQIRELRHLSPRLLGIPVIFQYGDSDRNLYITHQGVYEWCITVRGKTYGRAID